MICNTFFRLKTLFLDSKRSSLRHFGDGWKNHNICAWRTWLENVKRLLVACCLYNRVIPKKMIIRNWCRGLSRAAARVFDLCLTFYIYTHYAVPQRKSIFHLGRLWKQIVTLSLWALSTYFVWISCQPEIRLTTTTGAGARLTVREDKSGAEDIGATARRYDHQVRENMKNTTLTLVHHIILEGCF